MKIEQYESYDSYAPFQSITVPIRKSAEDYNKALIVDDMLALGWTTGNIEKLDDPNT